MLKRLRIVDIKVARNRRTPMKGRIASVAQSMRTIGQLNPITVHVEGNKLIAGLTRLRAAEVLDWKDIQCNVVDFDKLHAELAEIDENMERSNLTILEESQALARRKAIYLELNPETAQHVAGGKGKSAVDKVNNDSKSCQSATAESAVAETDPKPSFAADAAEQYGKAERTIRENVAIGENIVPAAAKAIKDTPIADNKGQLQQLVRLEPEQQVEVAEAIKSGEAETVKEAVAAQGNKPSKNGKPKVREKAATPADEAKAQVKIWADTVGRWLGKSPSIDELRGNFPSPKGDAVVTAATTLFEALKNWQKAIR